MQTRKLGDSDIHITPVGLGTWAIGGIEGRFNWGPQDDRESVDAIRHALDMGINWIDTAPAYGLGHAEEVVARALDGYPGKPYIFTKCSLAWGKDRVIQNNLKAESLRLECEDSLRRLRVEVLDLYQIHWPNPDEDIEEGWATLAKLKQEGKVRFIGVSNFSVEQMKRIQSIAPISTLQPPYSAIRRGAEQETLPFCLRNGIGVIVYSPMQTGLLSGHMTRERVAQLHESDWRRRGSEYQEPNLTRNLALQDLLGRIGARHGYAAAVAAIAWVLRRPEVTGAIVGGRRPSQVDGFITALEFRLSPKEIDEVDRFLDA